MQQIYRYQSPLQWKIDIFAMRRKAAAAIRVTAQRCVHIHSP